MNIKNKLKTIPYELNKEDMLQCDYCGEIFKIPTMFDECPNCHTTEFHRIDYPSVVEILADTSKLPFKSINYNQRVKTDKVLDGIYYVLCSETYSYVGSGERRYYARDKQDITFVPLDKAIIFTSHNAAFQTYAYSSFIRDAHCYIHKVVVVDKHIVEDLGKVNLIK